MIRNIIRKLFKRKEPEYKPYIERDTECDKCDFLKHCEKSGEVIRCTTSYDEREHFIRGMGAYCRKMNL